MCWHATDTAVPRAAPLRSAYRAVAHIAPRAARQCVFDRSSGWRLLATGLQRGRCELVAPASLPACRLEAEATPAVRWCVDTILRSAAAAPKSGTRANTNPLNIW